MGLCCKAVPCPGGAGHLMGDTCPSQGLATPGAVLGVPLVPRAAILSPCCATCALCVPFLSCHHPCPVCVLCRPWATIPVPSVPTSLCAVSSVCCHPLCTVSCVCHHPGVTRVLPCVSPLRVPVMLPSLSPLSPVSRCPCILLLLPSLRHMPTVRCHPACQLCRQPCPRVPLVPPSPLPRASVSLLFPRSSPVPARVPSSVPVSPPRHGASGGPVPGVHGLRALAGRATPRPGRRRALLPPPALPRLLRARRRPGRGAAGAPSFPLLRCRCVATARDKSGTPAGQGGGRIGGRGDGPSGTLRNGGRAGQKRG